MNYVRKHILRLFTEYADLERQHKEWTENVKKTYLTPIEFIEEWFDDTFGQNTDALVSRGEITLNEWELIKPFYEMFDKFVDLFYENEDKIPADMTTYEPWVTVSKKAKELKSTLERLGWTMEISP